MQLRKSGRYLHIVYAEQRGQPEPSPCEDLEQVADKEVCLIRARGTRSVHLQSDERAARVALLRSSIKTGDYVVDTGMLAEKMIQRETQCC